MLKLTDNQNDLRPLTYTMATSLTYLINHGNAYNASTPEEAVTAVIEHGNTAFLTDLAVRTGTSYKLFTLVKNCIISKEA